MSLRYKIILLFIFYIFMFPSKVNAEESLNYYLYADDEEDFNIYPKEIILNGNFSDMEKLQFLLENLLNYDGNMLKYISEDTEIKWITIKNNEAIVSFSNEIKNYGGCFYENALIYQLLKTVFEIDNINYFTLYIENKIDFLNEGSIVYKFGREKILDYEKNLLLQ